MPLRFALLLLSITLGLHSADAARAQSKAKPDRDQAEAQKPASNKPEKRSEPARKAFGLTPEREAAVMTFVKLNHPDLEMLLTHLKQSEPKEYEKAVRDLTRVIDRLAASKDRDADMYELELRSWKAQSRLQLLSARQAMGASDDLRDEMREVIREQGEVRTEILKREKQRIQDRLTRIESELSRLEKNSDRWVEQQLKSIAGPAPEKKPNKPAKNEKQQRSK